MPHNTGSLLLSLQDSQVAKKRRKGEWHVKNKTARKPRQAQINSAGQQFFPTPQQSTINEVAIILAAGATLACVIATLCGTIYSLLRSPYLLHYHSISPDSTVVAPLGDEGGFARGASQHSSRRIGTVTGQQSPVPIQQMEEQTVYWSARENPFYYHTSKRFYGQPYQVESG
ncbi:hypothetical protein ANCDUO_01079 [Ancylostoma duodenale]|uniref:Uncharacterized protein n=1 Tax=Ancylostoma duodenale TaxID=51022 RepID=A0A0C2DZV3_9BILA|nr:hypothetical protein ANCDUO_01079 [Ancylostoma duodenale]